MSSIIKGQRIRNESTLELENLSVKIAPEDGDKELTTDVQETNEDLLVQLEKTKIKAEMAANEIIKEANEEAEKIIAVGKVSIEKEAEIALEKAKEEGYSVGYTNGYEKGQLEAQALIEEGKQIVESATIEKKQTLDRLEPEIIEMILAISAKLIDEEIRFNPETIPLLIRKALGQINYDTTEISIKVSPEQYDYVLENKNVIVKDYTNPADVQIWKDVSLGDGSCIVETPFGSVECNVNEEFAEMKKQMRLLSNKK